MAGGSSVGGAAVDVVLAQVVGAVVGLGVGGAVGGGLAVPLAGAEAGDEVEGVVPRADQRLATEVGNLADRSAGSTAAIPVQVRIERRPLEEQEGGGRAVGDDRVHASPHAPHPP